MTLVLIRHEVADYQVWRSVFDAALELRHKHGEHGCRIFHHAGNVNDLILFFEWDNLEKARAFMASDELKALMAQGGVKGQPRIEFATEMYTVRRSAAD
jgi:antibiotic biosynthesis monooxygenase (ABM) superfamily enzyme